MANTDNDKKNRTIIIGSGPAAHTAAIYCARAALSPLMFEGFLVGDIAPGGQLTTTTEVENYPGFPDGIEGPKLMNLMRAQSERYGVRIITQTIESVDLSTRPFKVITEEVLEEFYGDSLIIATGATAKRLHLPGEEQYWQRGISACAICDGALPAFRNQPLVVIGGGDSACEEAMHLSKFGSKIYILVRRDVMRASKVLQQRIMDNEKIEVMYNTIATKVLGDDTALTTVSIENQKSGQRGHIKTRGLFYAIGHTPNTTFLDGQLSVDEDKYIITEPDSTVTSVQGVFAAGDVQDRTYRQAITAAGTGCMAALEVERFLAGY